MRCAFLRGLGGPGTFFVATGHIDSGLPYAYDWLAHMVVTMDADRLRLPALDLDLPLPSDRDARRALVGPVLDRPKYLDDAGQQAVIEDVALESSEAHTSELQSLMRISYSVFC